MASGGEGGRCSRSGSPCRDHHPSLPIAQGRVLPLVMHHCQPGESLSCADAHLGLLLCHDTNLHLLIGIGPRLPRR
jgi:hypothetical protein